MPADSAPRETVRLLIVSEVRLYGDGLAAALSREKHLTVCSTCASGGDAIAALGRSRPDVVLLDDALDAGLELVVTLKRLAPHIRVVVIALGERSDRVIAWAESGVAGYIPNTAGLSDIAPILLGIMAGEQICSRSVAAGMFRRLHVLATHGAAQAQATGLTARELQIVKLIGVGLSNKQIAHQLNISMSTTKSHVHNLLGKLNVPARAQAASLIGRQAGPNREAAWMPPAK
jgi:DNA-binding NarL/FixJ family response regulator